MCPAILDPIAASTNILGAYRRYLRTSFRPSNEGVRKEFEEALESGFPLSRGPFLQAAVPFASGASIAQLVAKGILHEGMRDLDHAAFPPERPLFAHQDEAVRGVTRGDNMLIATGTGSGKTECFLLPILDHLLRERSVGTLRQPGVRALLLYPMNALANDQMKRLRQLFSPFPDITFGRYIGDTKQTYRDALAIHRSRLGADPVAGELIDRGTMQARPPHVLLTNYAMLEYLLIRPDDSSLFDGETAQHWRFVVLDEVHVYDGAKGAELGMLLRRVRDRVHKSERGHLRCIATSATLGKGREDAPQLMDFAEQLFDEPFSTFTGEPNLVEAKRLSLAGSSSTWAASPGSFLLAQTHYRNRTCSAGDLATAFGSDAPAPMPNELVECFLDRALRTEDHVIQLQHLLQEGSIDAATAGQQVLGTAEAGAQLVALVDLCIAARPEVSAPPLLPARYHFLLRALEGAFYCLAPAHPSEYPRLLLSRHEQCPSCPSSSTMVELAVCRKCGASYAVGHLADDGSLSAARPIDERLDYFLLDLDWLEHETAGEEDEDEAALEGEVSAKARPGLYCSGCGTFSEGTKACGCGGQQVRVTQAVPAKETRDLRLCLACSGRANASIASRFLTGADAPVAVVASAFYQELPSSIDPRQSDSVGGGRKLLSFADSRQDAAFFAPYLERTYLRSVERRLLWEVVRNQPEEARFEDLVVPVRKLAERSRVLDEDNGARANGERARRWLYREIVGVDRRQSLEGVGLAEVTVALPREAGQALPPALEKVRFSTAEANDLVRVLLDTLRRAAAVWVPEDVDLLDPMFAPRNVSTVARERDSERGLLAWMPGRGINTRLDFVRRVLDRRGVECDAATLLSGIWTGWLAKANGTWSKVLTQSHTRGKGSVFAIDPTWITFLPVAEDHPAFRCDSCRQIWWRNISGVCPTLRCPGTLHVLQPTDVSDDHYRRLYTDLQLIGARVEEHTAQLQGSYAAQIQEDFMHGRVNILSCSTTFELGVDVGEVQGVLLRNVPPSAANYVQRAGRAGRRAGSAAMVTTFAQRRNHDLQVFDNPRSMVDGSVTPPLVSIDNSAIVRRHVHAMAFAAFERREVLDYERSQHRTVSDFFEADGGSTTAAERFMTWLRTHPSDLLDAVARVVPPSVAQEVGLPHAWIDDLDQIDEERWTGWLAKAEDEVRQELEELDHAYNEAKNDDRLSYAQSLKLVGATLRSRPLVNFLAQRVVLPKYGFPVDVVTLDVLQRGDRDSQRVQLDRDLSMAIVDYAPGATVVAAKALWQGIGLKKLPGRALVLRSWARCADCGAFRSRLHEGAADDDCSACHGVTVKDHGIFVEPSFGFVGQRSKEKPGDARPLRLGSAQRFFDEYQGSPPQEKLVDVGAPRRVSLRFSRQAIVTVLNGGGRGGYYICTDCGHGQGTPPPRRKKGDPWPEHRRPARVDSTCRGTLRFLQLGHRYLTDAVELRLAEGALTSQVEASSVLHAMLSAVPSLGVTRNDIDGATAPYGRGTAIGLFLFDAVPGGAGHAKYLARQIPELLRAAYDVVAVCECGEDTSCYACLRSYQNQREHDVLSRGKAKDVLQLVLGQAAGTSSHMSF